jgi:ABC-type uncharacterized transport system substrate-binding protein
MWDALKRLSLGVGLITLAAAVLLLSDLGRRARPTHLPEIAILQQSSQPVLDEGVEGIIEGLAAHGFVDGKTVAIRRYNAQGDMATASAIASEITDGHYDLVITASTLSMQAVANANRTRKVRHVFALVSDPPGAGVGISRDRPLVHPPYMAGYGTMQPVAETLRLAHTMFPQLRTLGVVWNPAESNSEAQLKLARATCAELGVTLLEATVDSSSGVLDATKSLVSRGVDAIWVGGDVTVLAAIDAVIDAARAGRIPVFTSIPGNTARGALFDLGANYLEVGRLTGELAARILSGTDPATVPVENVMPERLLVNREAFKDLKARWTLPDAVARRATFVGEGGAPPTPKLARAPAGRTFKIGVAYFAPEPGAEICMQGLFDGMREQGFVRGQNLEVHLAHAQGEIANIPPLLQSMDSQGLDLIVPLTTPCLTAACGTVRNTPVVFTYVYDPIAAGAGVSFTDHNPNVTGVGSFPPVDDTVELIQHLLPGRKVIGTLYNSSEANSRKVIEVARDAFARRGFQLEEVTVTNSSEVFQAAQALVARNVQAFWITGDNTAIQGFDGIVKVATDARLPIINNDPELVGKGALACVGIGFYESGRAAARLAARVLLGESPKDIPIENVVVKTLSINLDQARVIGVPVPDDLVAAADVVIDATGARTKPAPQAAPTPAPLARKWAVDLLQYVNVLDVEEGEKGIREGLRQAGLVEGRDYALRVRNAQGDMPTLSTLVDAALSEGTDLLMTMSTPTLQAAMQRARTVPIVFTFVADAIAVGAGRTNEDHLPNVTGVPTTAPYNEMLDAVHECVPSAHRLGTLFVPAEVNSVYNKDRLAEAAARRGLELVTVAANTSSEVSDATLALLAQNIDVVCQVGANLTTAAFASIAQPARRARVPVFGFLGGDLRNGAAVVVTRDYFDAGHEAATLAARVMRGERPADIPFQPQRNTRVLVNLDAARAVGLRIPDSLRQRAQEVIGNDQ